MMEKEVETVLEKYTNRIDPLIKELLDEHVSAETRGLLHYQINTGGKRLRPSLAILSCLLCSGKITDVLHVAAGLEILHTYTLIIDDIIDDSPKRRGKPTTWKKYGRSFAECISIDYGATLLSATAKSNKPSHIANIYSETLKTVMEGEMKDVLLEQVERADEPFTKQHKKTNVSFSTYEKMIGQKTASLFRASCEIGALSATASKKHIEALRSYGWHFGMAFQMIDDILDIYGGKTGKPRGQDIREHKLGNFVILLALTHLPNIEKKRLQKLLKQTTSHSQADIEEAINLIQMPNTRKKIDRLLNKHIQKGEDALSAFPTSKEKTILLKILHYSVARKK